MLELLDGVRMLIEFVVLVRLFYRSLVFEGGNLADKNICLFFEPLEFFIRDEIVLCNFIIEHTHIL